MLSNGRFELGLGAGWAKTEYQQGAEHAARQHGWTTVLPDDLLEMPSIFIGWVEQITEQLEERRERHGFSYYIVSDTAMETCAPIVARLSGA